VARGFVLGLFVAIAAVIAGGYLFVTSGALPAGQDAKPGALERWAAKTSLRATMRREARTLTSTLLPTDDNLAAGVALYVAQCQVCHGGPDAVPSSIARGLSPNAPQLARDGVEDDPEGTIYWKIAHGIRFTGMPAFRQTLADRELWQIALFLKHMDKLPPGIRQAWAAGRASH
jgi:mono/diheme cytochrome c family protein